MYRMNDYYSEDFSKPFFITKTNEHVELEQEDIQYYRARYAQNIINFDKTMGEIFKLFEKNNLTENTIFVLLSNHGEELYEHWVGHSLLYEQVINTPLLVRIPGQKSREFNDRLKNTGSGISPSGPLPQP